MPMRTILSSEVNFKSYYIVCSRDNYSALKYGCSAVRFIFTEVLLLRCFNGYTLSFLTTSMCLEQHVKDCCRIKMSECLSIINMDYISDRVMLKIK